MRLLSTPAQVPPELAVVDVEETLLLMFVSPTLSVWSSHLSMLQGRNQRLGESKESDVTVWKHDLYSGPGKSLGSRLSNGTPSIPSSQSAPRIISDSAAHALRQAVGLASSRSAGNLSIKGASTVSANVIQVENLAAGTTAADVEVCFP